MHYFVGVEGGTTSSVASLVDEQGVLMCSKEFGGTNHWLAGLEEVAKRIVTALNELRSQQSLSNIPLAVGLSLSGCDTISCQKKIHAAIVQENDGDLKRFAENVFCCNDSFGSMYSASKNGGILLIAGTGSNCCVINPDGSHRNCGGWGHILECRGSAYWIAHHAIRIVFNHRDNFEDSDLDVSVVERIMLEYFQVDDLGGMLRHFYTEFSKSFIAGFAARLAKQPDDPLVQKVFSDASIMLARHIVGLAPFMAPELKGEKLKVVLVGKVWNSWHPLLRFGFCDTLSTQLPELKYQLLQLTDDRCASKGAAYWAAQKAGHDVFPKDLSQNYSVLCDSAA